MKAAMTPFAMLLLIIISCSERDTLKEGFRNPPEDTKPWVYWYWIDENISKEGITKDLEAMARVGIGEALIGQVSPGGKKGSVPMLSDEWWEMVKHAVREGQQLGVDIGFFNGPGWSQSGGPWIQPEDAMQYVVSSERFVRGPTVFRDSLPMPYEHYRDISIIAFPATAGESQKIRPLALKSNPHVTEIEKLTDRDRSAPCLLSGKNNKWEIDAIFPQKTTIRGIKLYPARQSLHMKISILAPDSAGNFHQIREFEFDRRVTMPTVGPMRFAPLIIALPPSKSDRFRLVFNNLSNAQPSGIAEMEFTAAAVLDYAIEKQLGKMYPQPLPPWDAYLWPSLKECPPKFAVDTAAIIDLSKNTDENGLISWNVPEGDWVILRTAMTPTGVKNAPAPPQATGFECDKFDKAAVRKHFEAYLGKFFSDMPTGERTALKHIVIDSYEAGSQNWSKVMEREFIEKYGYDPKPWLPVFTGRIVQSRELSNRFLWDVRRLVADLIAENYVGGLKEVAHEKGLKLWLENYGHWGFPAEFLQYGGQSDEVSGEFWFENPYWNLGSIECRAASSAAHIYGKKKIFAEAYTAGFNFRQTPATMKARGDWAFTEGINHSVLHVYIHQPYEGRAPGVTAWFGMSFQRNNTWFEQSKAWIDYLRRCHYMLQQGLHVADVCYFIGEDAPKMTGIQKPELPEGYDFDYINAEVILNRLSVKNGLLTLPGGKSYKLMVLPPLKTMRPELLQKISELVSAGATILGTPPERSPSLRNYPTCDETVVRIAKEMWGTDSSINEISYGKGRIFHGISLEEVFRRLKTEPDVICAEKDILWTHRKSGEADIHFLSNQKNEEVSPLLSFRISGMAPELWHPGDGHTEPAMDFYQKNNRIFIPLTLPPHGSVFVVFRKNTPNSMASTRMATGAVLPLSGPWQVTFPAGWDTPGEITLDSLLSWTEYPDEGVKYFSGMATYHTAFTLDDDPGAFGKIILDLGSVAYFARVTVNGHDVGTLWKTPWTIDVSDAVKKGKNSLTVRVTNTWWNRLVGDEKYPNGFPGSDFNKPRTFTTHKAWKADDQLLPSGLLGPVRIMVKRKRE